MDRVGRAATLLRYLHDALVSLTLHRFHVRPHRVLDANSYFPSDAAFYTLQQKTAHDAAALGASLVKKQSQQQQQQRKNGELADLLKPAALTAGTQCDNECPAPQAVPCCSQLKATPRPPSTANPLTLCVQCRGVRMILAGGLARAAVWLRGPAGRLLWFEADEGVRPPARCCRASRIPTRILVHLPGPDQARIGSRRSRSAGSRVAGVCSCLHKPLAAPPLASSDPPHQDACCCLPPTTRTHCPQHAYNDCT